MEQFEVGEIAIFVPVGPGPDGLARRGGEDVEIVKPLDWYAHDLDAKQYGIQFADGRNALATPDCLRKKKPPSELSTWEEIQKITGWNPTKQEMTNG